MTRMIHNKKLSTIKRHTFCIYISKYICYDYKCEVLIMSSKNAKVFKSGNSQAISLNKSAFNEAGLSIGDELIVEIKDEQLTFTKKEKDIKDEIQDFYRQGGKYDEKEIDFGESVGKELW